MLTMLSVFGDPFFNLNRVAANDSINPLSVDTIRLSPEIYDGKMLIVSGQVRSLVTARGKIDSEFIILVLESSKTLAEDPSQVLNVFSYSVPPLKMGTRVIVSGIYHKDGRWAGIPRHHFIVATAITPLYLN